MLSTNYKKPTRASIQRFQKTVLDFYSTHRRRGLPWRKTKDPYRILVSEIMLQQTQVERVIAYYTRFLETFPTVQTLAQAPLFEVLTLWQGLGYNRRAKMLHETAKKVAYEHHGIFPKSAEALEELPGIGHYTARAVAAFAYNQDGYCIETNVRTVLFHHFYKDAVQVSDKELLTLLEAVTPQGIARTWYAALMDYGTYLKKEGVRVNIKSSHYIKQKTFKGSGREVRGAVLRALVEKPRSEVFLKGLFPNDNRVEIQLHALLKEGMILKTKNMYTLPS